MRRYVKSRSELMAILSQCLDKLRYLREAHPKRVWRVIERTITETVHEDDDEI